MQEIDIIPVQQFLEKLWNQEITGIFDNCFKVSEKK